MRGFVASIALALALTGCTGGDVGAGESTAVAPSPTSTEPSTVAEIDALFDAGGHQLHLHCQGSGSPTVIYLHGMSHTGDGGEANAESAGGLPGLLSAKRRYCGYDRANVGTSDDVPGPLTGASSARDLEKLLQAAEIEPPYVLLGASFGGLIAHIYAAEHPEQVTGLLLLDAGFPDELDLEKHFPPDERLNHGKTGFSGWEDSHEKIDELAAYEDAHALIGKEPDIPMTYLLAQPSTNSGPPAYEKAFPRELAQFASRYDPGTVVEVDSVHYMEAAIPDRISSEIDKLIAGR